MEKLIALTFDDGPNTTTTAQVLDLLEKHGIVASFFVIGNLINEESAKMMRRAAALGCELQNHSYTHDDLSVKTPEELREEIDRTSALIYDITGQKAGFFRPPYISVSETMWESISLPFICGFGCEDWVPEISAKERVERMLAQAKDGGITLLHDMEGNDATVEALEEMIPALLADGYRFVTISKLFEAKGVVPKAHEMYTYIG